jgi:phosphoesterase RecJ-like protein
MKSISADNISKILTKLGSANRVAIFSHENPDGDTIGSACALYGILKKNGIKASLVINDELPVFLQWLPYANEYIIYERNPKKATEIVREADFFFHIDYNSIGRTGKLASLIKKRTDVFSVMIDHHPNPDEMANYAYSFPGKSSTAEVLYNFLVLAGLEKDIDSSIATCIYTGIITDTGNFVFNSSEPGLFNVVAELLKTGIAKDDIYANIYYNFSYDRMKLLGFALSERMTYWPELGTAFICLYDKDLKRFNHKKGDTENMVNMLFYIRGLKFALLMVEKPGHIKISMRSRGSFPANYIASKYFNGGGHLNAAGAKCYASMEETVKKRIDARDITTVVLSNTNGHIEVYSWDLDAIEITAYKKVHGSTDRKARRLMEHLVVDIRSDNRIVNIKTLLPKSRNYSSGFFTWLFHGGNSASVHYELRVPKTMNLSLHSTNGAIIATDCSGDFNCSTTNGKIRLEDISGSARAKSTNGSLYISFRKFNSEKEMRFRTTNGSIKLMLPYNTNADLEARTTNGSIKCELPLTERYAKSRKRLEGEINDGGTLITLRTTNGSIKILEY